MEPTDANKLICVDRKKCVKCQACSEICPMGVIEISEDGFPEPKSCAYRLCINCGYCVDICAFDALRHKVRRRSSNVVEKTKRYEALKDKGRVL